MMFAVMSTSLSSCGFTPVYGENSSAREVLENLTFEDPNSRIEQLFLKAVEQRLPPPANPKYQVEYRIVLSYQGLDQVGASRVLVFGQVVSEFVDLNTSAVKFASSVDGFTSYTYSSEFAEFQKQDAEERLMQILADKFITRLMIQSQKLGENEG